MATSAATLVQRVRRYLRDWPDADALSASVTSSATTITVSNGALFTANWPIEVDQELMLIRSVSSNTLTVKRGARGSTAASHAASAAVLNKPHWSTVEILDALNAGLDAAFPLLYKPVLDTSLTILNDTYEYTVPNMPSTSTPIPYLSKVELKDSGDSDYWEVHDWTVRRGATPKIKFRRVSSVGATVRVHGFGPFTRLAYADSLDALFPDNAVDVLVQFAAQHLLVSGEAGRVRSDTQAIDSREQANRVGSSMSAANGVWQRFQVLLQQAAMAPLPRHVRRTF